MNHDYALDNTDQQEAREARRDPAYWAEDAARRLPDRGEYEGDWLERQDNRHSCPYCFGTGLAPGDGRTECGFCCHG